MKLNIEINSGELFSVNIDRDESIKRLKELILTSDKIGTKENIRILYNLHLLSEENDISDYGIEEDSVLKISYSLNVRVSTPYEGLITIECDPCDRVKLLRKKIEKTLNKKFDNMDLNLRNKGTRKIITVKDEQTLSELKVNNDSRFFLQKTITKTIKIRLTFEGEKEFDFILKPSDKVAALRSMFVNRRPDYDYLAIYWDKYSLQLKDENTFESYGINKDTELCLYPVSVFIITEFSFFVLIGCNKFTKIKEVIERTEKYRPDLKIEYLLHPTRFTKLDTDSTLSDYGFNGGVKLNCIYTFKTINVKVKLFDGKVVQHEFKEIDNLQVLKRKLAEKIKMPTNLIHFKDVKFDVKSRIYSITLSETFHIILRINTFEEKIIYGRIPLNLEDLHNEVLKLGYDRCILKFRDSILSSETPSEVFEAIKEGSVLEMQTVSYQTDPLFAFEDPHCQPKHCCLTFHHTSEIIHLGEKIIGTD